MLILRRTFIQYAASRSGAAIGKATAAQQGNINTDNSRILTEMLAGRADWLDAI